MAARKKSTAPRGRTAPLKRTPARRRGTLAPGKQARGLTAADTPLSPESPEIAALSAQVRSLCGAPIGAYREPLSGRPQARG